MGDRDHSTYRVVQWATGNIGTRSLRDVIEHPDLSLVGLYVYSPDKAGRDAGELCGLGCHRGARHRRPRRDPRPSAPTACCTCRGRCDIDEVCRLLASGANIVTTRGEFHHPGSMDPETRDRIEAACRAGGTSIHSTGSSPGFISEAVPLVLTSIQRELEGLVIEEFADLSRRNSPELLFDLMGFGTDPGAFDPGRWSHGAAELRSRRSGWWPRRCRPPPRRRWRPAARSPWPDGRPSSPPAGWRPVRWPPSA